MLARYSIVWYALITLVMLAQTSESAYSLDKGYNSLLPPSLVHLISLARWGAWIVFILDGIAANVRMKQLTKYHMRFLAFYAIFFLSALIDLGDPRKAIVLNSFFRYVGLWAIAFVVPLQLESYIKTKGLDATLRLLLYSVILLTLVGVAATLRATGFNLRYTGWVDNPNSFVLINVFFITIAAANYIYRSAKPSILIPTLLFLVFTQLAAGSRQGFLGLLVVFFVYFARSGQNIKQAAILGFFMAAGLALFIYFGPKQADRIFEYNEETLVEHDTGRLAYWESLMPHIEEKWLIGWGVNGREFLGRGNSHNMYLTLMLFFGIPGGVLVGCYFIFCCLSGIFLNSDRSPTTNVSLLFSGYLCSVFITMAFEDTIFGIGSPWTLQIVLAIGIVNALSQPGVVRSLREIEMQRALSSAVRAR